MKKKILIIGENSFISLNLKKLLQKSFMIKVLSLKNFKKLDRKKFNEYSHIVNCTIHKKYISDRYNPRYDFDLQISKKLKYFSNIYVFLSTRKVYELKDNIKETDNLNPRCNYSKNKLITENSLQKIFKKKLLILRISNIIGLKLSEKKGIKLHFTFIDHFFYNISKNIIFNNSKNIYKDFLSINQFSKILRKLINFNSTGIFNVGIGKKVYVNQIVTWLNFYNKNICRRVNLLKKFNKDRFYLDNKKLFKEIELKFSLTDLEEECKKISKSYFKYE